MSRASRSARRRLRIRALERRLARVGPRGTFLPHREPAAVERGAPALEPLFAASTPAFTAVLDALETHGAAFARFGGPAPAPRFAQDWFPGLDAAALYALVRREQPTRILEIGSGHSTRIMARAIAEGGLATRLTAVDPAPRAPIRALPVDWRPLRVQAAPASLAGELRAGDVMLVDSSHVLVAGSDVDVILTDLVPRLAPGTLLHVHDVFLPDPYPAAWAWRGYNEQQAIAGLLLGGFELVFASHWVRTRLAHRLGPVASRLPLAPGARETSLWLKRR